MINKIFTILSKSKTVFWSVFLTTFSILVFCASKVEYNEDISHMFSTNIDSKSYSEAINNTNFLDKIIVRVNGENFEDSKTYADAFVKQLSTKKQIQKSIREIRYKVTDEQILKTFEIVQRNIPFFLSDSDYKKIDSLVTPQQIQVSVESTYNRLVSPASLVLKKFSLADPTGISALAFQKFQTLQQNNEFAINDGYISSKDGKNIYIIISHTFVANDTKQSEPLLNEIDATISKISKEAKGSININYFGSSAIALCNARQIKQDILLTVNISILLILGLLFFFYRNFSTPILVLSPAAFGVVFSLAAIFFIKGKISVLALGAGSVVLGIAVDYAFHIITHYMHSKSINDLLKDITLPLIIGSSSTVAAFLSLLYVKSQILADFGLFSGLSLIGAAIFTLVFLPHLTSFIKLHNTNSDSFSVNWIKKIIQISPEKNKFVLAIVFALTILFIWYSSEVQFEDDISKMNYMTEDLMKEENHYFETANGKQRNIYLILKGKTFDDALNVYENKIDALKQLKTNKQISGFFDYTHLIPSQKQQNIKLSKWNSFWTKEKTTFVQNEIEKNALNKGFKPNTFSQFYNSINQKYTTISPNDYDFLKNTILKDYVFRNQDNVAILCPIKIQSNFESENATNLLSSKNKSFLLDKKYIYNKLVALIKYDFNYIQIISSVLVFVILWFSFGRLELTLIAYIPMLISWFWILGIMAIFHLKFNIVNIIISTFVFGIGDDYAIFFVDGLEKKYKEGKETLVSYKNSVFLSALTTLIGMGILIFAKHPALKSIAFISVLGILSVVVISYTLIPFLYNIFILKRIEKKLPPITFSVLLRSFWVYSYFILGSLIFTFLSWIILELLKFKRYPKAIFAFRLLVSMYLRILLKLNFMFKKNTINLNKNTFNNPALLIANHQSFLDIILLLALHPRIIIMTNSWVWNSPIFGRLIKLLGFYNISEGAEESLEYIKQKTQEGYSILIFPEGTRSVDGEIKRFHKGAFYLAKTLRLDIIPILLHGTGDGIRKNDFMLNRTDLYIKIFNRVNFLEIESSSYQELAKHFTQFFRTEYSNLKSEIPTKAYYYKILSGYIYKGPILEWYYRIKVTHENYYEYFDKLIPSHGLIYDIGCGYGFMSYFLTQKSQNRTIIGIDYDSSKIELANNVFLKTPQNIFHSADATNFEYNMADTFVIMDMLHYLTVPKQIELLKICIKNLNPNGVIIVRDGNPEKTQKQKVTSFTEYLSTKVFKFNKTNNQKLEFTSFNYLINNISREDLEIKTVKESTRSSNSIFIIKKK